MSGAAPPGADPERILPDGCVEIVFNLADPFRHLRTSAPATQPREMLVAAIPEHMLIQATGSIDIVGIRLRPGGVPALVNDAISGIDEMTAPLRDLDHHLPRSLAERLAGMSKHHGRYQLVIDALRRVARPERVDARVAWAARRIQHAKGRLPIETLRRQMGVSTRTLERLFQRDVGLGPKKLSRILRIQSVVRGVNAGRSDPWRRLALRVGYFDESHFVRDFQSVAGVTPGKFFGRAPDAMSNAFTTGADERDDYLQDQTAAPT
jgi:AraC-like DNA-binding protein